VNDEESLRASAVGNATQVPAIEGRLKHSPREEKNCRGEGKGSGKVRTNGKTKRTTPLGKIIGGCQSRLRGDNCLEKGGVEPPFNLLWGGTVCGRRSRGEYAVFTTVGLEGKKWNTRLWRGGGGRKSGFKLSKG